MAFLDAGKDEKEQVNSAFVYGPDKWKKTSAARLGNLFIFFQLFRVLYFKAQQRSCGVLFGIRKALHK